MIETTNSLIYPVREDCVWLGSDMNDNVAAFFTCGNGPIPKEFLTLSNFRINEYEVMLLELPVTSECVHRISMPTMDVYCDLTSRGLFVYDWIDGYFNGRDLPEDYLLATEPKTPILRNVLIDCINKIHVKPIDVTFGKKISPSKITEMYYYDEINRLCVPWPGSPPAPVNVP